MKFRKEGKKIFSIGQTFYFSYLQMTMSKQCNKMTFLIYSLLHLVNLGDIFPSRAFKGKLCLTREEVPVCRLAVGVRGAPGGRKEAGVGRA